MWNRTIDVLGWTAFVLILTHIILNIDSWVWKIVWSVIFLSLFLRLRKKK